MGTRISPGCVIITDQRRCPSVCGMRQSPLFGKPFCRARGADDLKTYNNSKVHDKDTPAARSGTFLFSVSRFPQNKYTETIQYNTVQESTRLVCPGLPGCVV